MTEMYQAAMAKNPDHASEEILSNHYPLHFACYCGNEASVQQLLMSGRFDVYQEDGLRGWTPLHWAAYSGHWKCLELIKLYYGVDLDVRNTRINQTPTHVAAHECRLECIAWLVQQGISLGVQDHMGDTPLHIAVKHGNLDCVKLLTSHGPSLSVYNNNGHTPLDIANHYSHQDCKAYLEEAQASQHSSFLPTSSSPILMNGEGIYQRDKPRLVGCMEQPNVYDQDMEMEQDIGGNGDAVALCQSAFGVKRSFDDEDEPTFKRRKLFASSPTEKMGTFSNNNVLSSYNGILAMSTEPSKPPVSNHLNNLQQVHAMAEQPAKPQLAASNHGNLSSSSVQDMRNAIQAQAGYDSLVFQSMIESDHGT